MKKLFMTVVMVVMLLPGMLNSQAMGADIDETFGEPEVECHLEIRWDLLWVGIYPIYYEYTVEVCDDGSETIVPDPLFG